MLQLNNHTPFQAELTVLNDETGVDTLYLIVKASFTDTSEWVLADEPLPVWKADEYYAEPDSSSLRYPSEIHLGKMATDVLVEGEAWAPEGRSVTQQSVSVAVGQVNQTMTVWGDRVWEQGRISAPEPFERMPLCYERAYGGALASGERWLVYDERNPVGRFALARCPEASIEGELLPNIEQPQAPLRTREDCPEPLGIGPVAPHWQPRTRFVGTYDQSWRQQRAPFAPEDFSRRFFNVAAPGLVYPGWLAGGEPFELSGLNPEGIWRGRLPEVNLSVAAQRGQHTEALESRLETVFLKPAERTLSMTWRASLSCSKRVLEVESVTVALARKGR